MNISCIVDVASREVSFQDTYRIASYDHNVDVIHFSVEPIEDFSLNTSSIKIAAQGPNKARHDYAVDPSTVAIEEETGYITFDWPIPAGVTEMPIGTFKYGDRGQLIFAVCAEIISGDTVSKAWHSDDGIITVVAHLEPEAGGGEDPEEEATNAQKIAQLQTNVAVMGTQIGALANGSPTPARTVAEMTEHDKVYLYTGSETGYTSGNWYFWNGSAWTSGGVYGGVTTSTTFDKPGVPADDFAVGEALADKADANDLDDLDDRVTALESGASGGLTADIKTALLACFRGLAWKGDADPVTLYQALDVALNPPANLSRITAVYTQSGAVDISDSLETLRPDLTVTAYYTDSTSETVTAYNLSGTLAVGTSTVTVSYGGKTATFDVTVTSSWMYIWDLTKSLTDTVSGRVAVASAGTGVDAPAITNDGLAFTAATQMLSLGDINLTGKIIEIDVASMDFKGLTSAHIRFLCNMLANGTVGMAPIIYHKDNGWAAYIRSGTASSPSWTATWTSTKDRNLFSGKTVKLVSGSDSTELYLDGELLRSLPKFTYEYGSNAQNVCIAGLPSYSQSGGDQCYDMVVSGIRIKDAEVA